jgi:mannose-6-phosphate isomerase-like protein (cupin superfamily)
MSDVFDKNVVKKPWGEEFNIYRNKKKLCITYLKIKPGEKTSLHCHPKKKTGFMILSGSAKIQLGLESDKKKIYRSPSKIMIREGLFHSIQCISKNTLHALEFETPVDKNNLVRFKDNYGRILKPYESKFFFRPFNQTEKNKIINKKFYKQKWKIKNIFYEIENHKDFKKIIQFNKNDICAVVDGNITDFYNREVLSLGDIILKKTLIKMSEVFSIKKKLVLLRLSKLR